MDTVNALAPRAREYSFLLLLNDDLHPTGPFLSLLLQKLETRNLAAAVPTVWRRPGLTESLTAFRRRLGLYWPTPGRLRLARFLLPYAPATAVLLRVQDLPEPLFPPALEPGYMEDVALSFFFRLEGKGIAFVPTPPLLHEGGASFGHRPFQQQLLFLRNLLLLHSLVFGPEILNHPLIALRAAARPLWRTALREARLRLTSLNSWSLPLQKARALFETPNPF